MACTWGSLALNVQGFDMDKGDGVVVDMPLLPTPGATTSASVQMSGSISKQRWTVQGWATVADFQSMDTDRKARTSRTLTVGDFNMTARLDRFTQAQVRTGTSLVWYTAEFLEAS